MQSQRELNRIRGVPSPCKEIECLDYYKRKKFRRHLLEHCGTCHYILDVTIEHDSRWDKCTECMDWICFNCMCNVNYWDLVDYTVCLGCYKNKMTVK